MTRKNKVGNWGRKTKPTQGASVNTSRHCSERNVGLFSQAIYSQASYGFFSSWIGCMYMQYARKIFMTTYLRFAFSR